MQSKCGLNIGGLKPGIPIIQGGMGVGYSLHSLSSAVAKEGGIGVIATAGIGCNEPDFTTNYKGANARALRKEIRKAKELSGGGLIGVNILGALSNFDDKALISIEEGVDFIFSGAGLPLKLPALLSKVPNSHTRLVPIVSSGRALDVIARTWMKHYDYFPDAAIVEGPLAGGHLGYKYDELGDNMPKLEDIFLDVLKAAHHLRDTYKRDLPLIAAGGIFDSADIRKFLDLGAAGVQMGTRFVATHEADASLEVKELYLRTRPEDVIIIKSPVGMPGRAINNSFLEAVARGEKIPFKCPYHCIKTCMPSKSPYCIAFALINAVQGRLKDGFAFTGSNVTRIKEIVSVHDLINELMSGV